MEKLGFELRLQSLRGLAALAVALSHGMCAFYELPSVPSRALRLLIWLADPAAAVCFFFVLSGYVLALSLQRAFEPTQFYVQRFFRIFPALAASIVIAFALRSILQPKSGMTATFTDAFSPPLQLWDLINNLLLQSYIVNGPTWSIYPEVIGSFWLPTLVYAHSRIGVKWQWPLFAAGLGIMTWLFNSQRLLIWFYCGFFLPSRVASAIRKDWQRLNIRTICCCTGIALLRIGAEFSGSYQLRFVLPTAVGASLIIAGIISDPTAFGWLRSRAAQFVGRVSYSFYLLHWPMFGVIAIGAANLGLSGFVGNFVVCCASIAAALVAAEISYRLVERPGIRTGRFFTRSAAVNPEPRLVPSQATTREN